MLGGGGEEGHCLRDQAGWRSCGSVRPVALAIFGGTSLTTLLQMVAHCVWAKASRLIPRNGDGFRAAIGDQHSCPSPWPRFTVGGAHHRHGLATQFRAARESAAAVAELLSAFGPRLRRVARWKASSTHMAPSSRKPARNAGWR